MDLDVLDFPQILEAVLAQTISQEAKDLLKERSLSKDVVTVEKRLDEVAEAVLVLGKSRQLPFLALATIRQIMDKLAKGYVLTAGQLVQVADFLRGISASRAYFKRLEGDAPLLASYAQALEEERDLVETLYGAVVATGVLSSADRQLAKCRKQQEEVRAKMEKALQKALKNPTYQDYLQESMVVERNGLLCLALKASFKNKIPGQIVEASAKGLTVYMQPQAVASLSQTYQDLQGEEASLENQILWRLSEAVAQVAETLEKNLEILVQLDAIFALGKYSRSLGGRKVAVNRDNRLILDQVSHPLLEDPVPLSLSLDQSKNLLITGMNAGGKTLVLKTLGLLSAMTMFGLLIPAGPATEIPLVDHIFAAIGDQQDISQSLSTFSSQMRSLAQIMQQANKHSLVLLDEIGSGTDPKEGTALAIAALQELYPRGLMLVATTHYDRIKDYALANPYFQTAAMGFDLDSLQPTYQLQLDQVGESKAYLIAQRMGLPAQVVQAAEKLAQEGLPQTFPQPQKIKGKQQVDTSRYHKGDIVFVGSLGQEGIFYAYDSADSKKAQVFVDKAMTTVPTKRLQLRRLAKDLYPDNYNLEGLFIADYQAYKFQRDLRRGSKKAWKQYDKGKRS